MILLLLGDSGFGRLQLRQIRAAMAAGRLSEQPLLVVGERAGSLQGDPAAAGATLSTEPALDYLRRNLMGLPRDCRIVPAPIGHHVFAQLLADLAGGELVAPEGNFALPFVRRQDGVVYLSAAAWACPPDCMAPAVCPRIALRRNWHLPSLLRAWARAQGIPSIVFAPRGPSSGAESIAAPRLQAALRRVRRGGRFLVATAAPCHAAASLLEAEGTGCSANHQRGIPEAVWIVVYLTGRKAEAERIKAMLAREGFLAEMRGETVYEVVVPEAEAPDAQEVIQRA